MNTNNRIATVEHEARTIMGTNWPVESFVTREEHFGKPYWLLTKYLCNGVPQDAKRFNTRKAALEELHSLGKYLKVDR